MMSGRRVVGAGAVFVSEDFLVAVAVVVVVAVLAEEVCEEVEEHCGDE